jgi:hypothetical protein
MADELACSNSPIFPSIATVALLVECQPNDATVLIFPFTGEDMAVTELRPRRGRRRIRGHSLLNRWPGACRRKDCGDKKERGS